MKYIRKKLKVSVCKVIYRCLQSSYHVFNLKLSKLLRTKPTHKNNDNNKSNLVESQLVLSGHGSCKEKITWESSKINLYPAIFQSVLLHTQWALPILSQVNTNWNDAKHNWNKKAYKTANCHQFRELPRGNHCQEINVYICTRAEDVPTVSRNHLSGFVLHLNLN